MVEVRNGPLFIPGGKEPDTRLEDRPGKPCDFQRLLGQTSIPGEVLIIGGFGEFQGFFIEVSEEGVMVSFLGADEATIKPGRLANEQVSFCSAERTIGNELFRVRRIFEREPEGVVEYVMRIGRRFTHGLFPLFTEFIK